MKITESISHMINLYKLGSFLNLFLLLITINAYSLEANNNRIDLELRAVTLERALDTLEILTEYKFFYKNEDVNLDQKVDVKVKNVSIDYVLSELLNGEDINFKILKNKIILKKNILEISHTQEYIIQGKVVDSHTGLPVGNCNIILGDTNTGTSTNQLGEFEIKVSDLSEEIKLTFSHLNYEKQIITISGIKPRLISLTPLVNSLDAIVVSGNDKDYYAIDLAKKAFDKTIRSLNTKKYGRALYRQTSKNGEVYSEFAEIIYDVRYTNSGIEDWNIIEGRYALKKENINNKNFTLLSRLMRTVQPNTNDLFFPLNESLETQYNIEILEHLISETDKIAVLWFKPKKESGTNRPLFQGEVYVNTVTYEVLKVTGEIDDRDDLELIRLTERGTEKKNYKLSYEMAFKRDSISSLIIDYIDVFQEFDYYDNNVFYTHVSAKSSLNFFEHYTPSKRKKLGARFKGNSSDWQKLNEIGYDKNFWEDNPIVKRTPVEEDVISAFETDNTFESIFLNSRNQIAELQSNISNLPFVKDLSKDVRLYNNYNPIEKVYLHTDKDLYLPGEDIWYSSYVTLGTDHYFSLGSRVLYVELINSDGEIIQTQEQQLINGRGGGALELPKLLTSGTYKIRSYTNWMQNEDEALFFIKTIKIIDETIIDNKKIIANNDEIDLQFFPEGGDAIAGLNNLIAFKAVGVDGLSREVKGRIVDSNDRVVVNINSIDQGAGFFNLKPEQGVSYKAVLDNGQEVSLPEIKTEGYVISVNNQDVRNIRVKVEATTSIKNNIFYIIGQIRNQKYYQARFGFGEKDVVDFEIPKNRLPSGVLTLTLLDEQKRPWSERVLFIDNEEELVITVKPNRKRFNSRDEINLEVEITDSEGKPISTDLSIAVTDADKVDIDQSKNNILTHVLLQSEIKGFIENPAIYFKDRKRSTRSRLDLVMLTNGWRRFNWKKLNNKTYDQDKTFNFQQGLIISGTASNKKGKLLKNTRLNMRAKSANDFKLYSTITNIEGNFKISNFNQLDLTEVEFNAYDPEGRPIDVDIILDEKVSKDNDEKILPDLRHKSSVLIEKNEEKDTKKYVEITRRRQETDSIYNQRFNFKGVNELAEVLVEAEINKSFNTKKAESVFGNLVTPDAVLEFNESNNNVPFIGQLKKIPGISISGSNNVSYQSLVVTIRGTASFNIEAGVAPLWVLDDVPFTSPDGVGVPAFIANLSTTEIDRVEVLKGPKTAAYGVRAQGGVILVYTRRGGAINIESSPDIISPDFTINGFKKVKEFYSPKYNVKQDYHAKPDYRTTLYWNSNIRTGKDGKASITFYNSDISRKLEVSIEALAPFGIPGTYIKTFRDN